MTDNNVPEGVIEAAELLKDKLEEENLEEQSISILVTHEEGVQAVVKLSDDVDKLLSFAEVHRMRADYIRSKGVSAKRNEDDSDGDNNIAFQ